MRRRPLLAGGWIAAVAGGGLLDLALKRVFHRTRPTWDVPLLTARGWSFPSGHAMGSLIAYGMLAYLLVRDAKGRRPRMAIVVGAVLLVLLIGLSRMDPRRALLQRRPRWIRGRRGVAGGVHHGPRSRAADTARPSLLMTAAKGSGQR